MLDELVREYPDAATVLNNKGFNLSMLQRYREAIPILEKAITISPSTAYSWNNLGFAEYKTGGIEIGLVMRLRNG